jgi:hypothetical protein
MVDPRVSLFNPARGCSILARTRRPSDRHRIASDRRLVKLSDIRARGFSGRAKVAPFIPGSRDKSGDKIGFDRPEQAWTNRKPIAILTWEKLSDHFLSREQRVSFCRIT